MFGARLDKSVNVDRSEEVTGQKMTAFTAGIWRALRRLAPRDSDFRYDLEFDRNKKPSESLTDVSTTRVRPPGLLNLYSPRHSYALAFADS